MIACEVRPRKQEKILCMALYFRALARRQSQSRNFLSSSVARESFYVGGGRWRVLTLAGPTLRIKLTEEKGRLLL